MNVFRASLRPMQLNLGRTYLKLLFALICSLSVPLSPYAQTVSDQRIAVLELSNPAGLSKQEVNYLSDLMRRLASSELAQSFLVIDKANIMTLLPPDKTEEDCIGECAVETGRLLQAAYIITGDIIRFGPQLRVTVKLHDTRTGRLIASEVASGREVMDMETGIQEAGGRLLRRLISKSVEPSGESERRRIGGQETSTVGSGRRRLIVTLRSEPSGAVVTVDGVQKCAEGSNSCEVELSEGAHQVRMSKTDYFERSGSVTFSGDRRELSWALDPNFATLEVEVSPSSLRYTINGEPRAGSFSRRVTPQKSYRVVSADPCYMRVGEEVKAGKSGDSLRVNLAPRKRYASLDLSARDPDGKPLEADVYIDGDRVGVTPSSFKVWVCSKTLKLSHGVHGEDVSSLSLEADERARRVVTLNDSAGARAKRLKRWAWLSAGLAIASVGASIYNYQLADKAKAEFPSTLDNPNRYDEMKAQFNQKKLFAYGGAVGAFLLSATSLGLFSWSANTKSSAVSLTPHAHGVMSAWSWRW